MSLYEYKCEGCEQVFEVNHSMNENPFVLCPECKTNAKRIISGGTGFIMKGPQQKDTGILCGRERTCCGKSTPCAEKPCHG